MLQNVRERDDVICSMITDQLLQVQTHNNNQTNQCEQKQGGHNDHD